MKKEILTEADFKEWIQGIIQKVKNKIGRNSIKVGDVIIYDYRAVGYYQSGNLNYFDAFPLVIVTSVVGIHFTGFT